MVRIGCCCADVLCIQRQSGSYILLYTIYNIAFDVVYQVDEDQERQSPQPVDRGEFTQYDGVCHCVGSGDDDVENIVLIKMYNFTYEKYKQFSKTSYFEVYSGLVDDLVDNDTK